MSRDITAASKPSGSTVTQNSASTQLDKQIADFLKSGGKIEKIPNGMSASMSPATRQKPRTMKGTPPPKR